MEIISESVRSLARILTRILLRSNTLIYDRPFLSCNWWPLLSLFPSFYISSIKRSHACMNTFNRSLIIPIFSTELYGYKEEEGSWSIVCQWYTYHLCDMTIFPNRPTNATFYLISTSLWKVYICFKAMPSTSNIP